jgi:hypothetical protein
MQSGTRGARKVRATPDKNTHPSTMPAKHCFILNEAPSLVDRASAQYHISAHEKRQREIGIKKDRDSQAALRGVEPRERSPKKAWLARVKSDFLVDPSSNGWPLQREASGKNVCMQTWRRPTKV